WLRAVELLHPCLPFTAGLRRIIRKRCKAPGTTFGFRDTSVHHAKICHSARRADAEQTGIRGGHGDEGTAACTDTRNDLDRLLRWHQCWRSVVDFRHE
ncbi:MAG: hypothetical protein WA199_19860, partial [Xanthobacteraceae bacterium]